MLVEFQSSSINKTIITFWNLGILLFPHPRQTVICKVKPSEPLLSISENVVIYDGNHHDNKLSIIYLNMIHGDSCAIDGFIESKIDGLDVILRY